MTDNSNIEHILISNKEKYDHFIELALQEDLSGNRIQAKEFLTSAKNCIDQIHMKKIFFYFLVAYKSYEIQSDVPLKQIIDSFRFMEDKKIKEIISKNPTHIADLKINEQEITFEFSPEEVFILDTDENNQQTDTKLVLLANEDTTHVDSFQPEIDFIIDSIEVSNITPIEDKEEIQNEDLTNSIQNIHSEESSEFNFDISIDENKNDSIQETTSEILFEISTNDINETNKINEESNTDSLDSPIAVITEEATHLEDKDIVLQKTVLENIEEEKDFIIDPQDFLDISTNMTEIDIMTDQEKIQKKNLNYDLIPTLTDIIEIAHQTQEPTKQESEQIIILSEPNPAAESQAIADKKFKTWVNWFLLINENMVMQRDYFEMRHDPKTKDGIFEIEDMLYAKANGQPWAVSVITTNN